MRYRYTLVYKDKPLEGSEDISLESAQERAINFVQDRMDAFGEDREALKGYGFTDAMDAASSIGEDGGYVYVPDGYRIEVTPLSE